ncbi:MAG: hypothetical protein ACK4WD_15430 [Flavobacteriales bacterium]|jgi:hypothetical protein
MKYFMMLLIVSLLGCGAHKGVVWYDTISSKDMVLNPRYLYQDTLYLKYFSMGTWNEKVGVRGTLGSSIDYEIDSVWHHIIAALEKTNIPLKISETPEHIQIDEWYKIRTDSSFFRKKILEARRKEDNSETLIIPIIQYYSSWQNELNAGLTFGSISPSDRLEHLVLQTVYICVIQNNDLKYFSASGRSDTLTREPSEPYRYHFPQELWDTLVYMSTRDYEERMK